jgi:hypothetical protein
MDRRLGAGCPTGEKGWQERSGRWWRLGSCGSGRGGRWGVSSGDKACRAFNDCSHLQNEDY